MKSILAVFFLILFKPAFSQTIPDSSRTLRVLTFNIYHGATMKGDFDLDRIAGIINDSNPDLVALQEVDHQTNRSRKYHLMNELASRTGLSPLFARSMYFDGGEYGNGILSRFSFIRTRVIPLPTADGKEPRTAVEVVVKINEKDTISFIGTHLDHTGVAFRLKQIQRLTETFSSNSYPTILAGDLNAVPGSETIRLLENNWDSFVDIEKYESTFPDYDHPENARKLDYIMASPKGGWRMLETQVIKDNIASDHYALLMVLELRN